jgi:CHAT domain-containing protein/tetratricopeptide (TPR) repeat protein
MSGGVPRVKSSLSRKARSRMFGCPRKAAGVLLLLLAATVVPGGPAAQAQDQAQQPPAAEAPAAAQTPATNRAAELAAISAAAREHMRAGRHADAAPLAEQALKLTESLHGADAVETAVAAHNLGFLLRRAGRTADAQRHMERALAIYERVNPAVHEDTRNLVMELGQIYVSAGRGEDVLRIYERLIERAGREGYAAHIGVADMHNNMAFLLRGLKRHDDGAAQWEKALAIYKAQPSDEEPYRLALEGLIEHYRSQGKTDQTRALIADALAGLQSRGAGEGKLAVRLLLRLGRLDHAAGRYDEARQRAASALGIVQRRPSETAMPQIEALNDLARAERALGNYRSAEQNYKQAIALLGETDVANAGILTDNLATLYGLTDRFEEAEPQHKRALQLLEQALGREHREVGHAAANFGVMLNEADRFAEAEPLLRRALTIAEAQSPQEPVNIAIILDNIAGVLRMLDRMDEALTHQQRATTLFEKALPASHPTVAQARNNLGRLLLDMGRPDDAEAQFLRSLESAEAVYGEGHVNVSVTAANLGAAYIASKQYDKARAQLDRALRGLERGFGASHTKLTDTLVSLGELELAAGRANQAVGVFERAVAVELAGRNRVGATSRQDHRQSAAERRAFFGLLEALWKAGGGQVPALTMRALEMGQWNTMSSAAMALAALGARAGASDPALAALTRERQDLTADWQATDKAITALLSESGQRDLAREKGLREHLAAAETRLAAIDQELQLKFPRFGDLAKPAPLKVEELRAMLRPNEAALQYVVAPEAVHLWLVTSTQVGWVRIPISVEALSDRVSALRCGLDRAEWTGDGRKRCLSLLRMPPETRLRPRDALPFSIERAQALHDLLLGPVGAAVAGKDLLIVASGPLTSLPFHVLVTGKPPATPAGEAPDFARVAWLGKSNAVTMLPSLASLKSLRQLAQSSRAASPFIGIGNPLLTGQNGDDRSAWARQSCDAPALEQRVAEITSPASLLQLVRGGIAKTDALRRQTPLPETADELCSVARYVKAAPESVLLGASATEARVKSLSRSGRLADARILHLATHGLLAGETRMFLASRSEPSLILTPPDTPSEEDDGLLTATEVAALKLDADWVILSACNTASGGEVGADALSGLARAFFYAGARSLLVSHWAVDSDATVNLITGAVAAMTREPRLTQAEALRRSMLALIATGGREAHPAYWAPFIVVGSSGPAAPELSVEAAPPAPAKAAPAATAPQMAVAPAPVAQPAAAKQAATTPPAAAPSPPKPAVSSATAAQPVVSAAVTTSVEALVPPLPARAPAALKKASVKPAATPRTGATALPTASAQSATQSPRPPRRKAAPLATSTPHEAGDPYNR